METIAKRLWARLMTYFLTGVFAVLPLVITFAVVAWVAGFLHRFVGPTTPIGRWLGNLGVVVAPQSQDSWVSQLLGWAIVLVALTGLGFALVELGARKLLGKTVDSVVARIPLVGQIYGTSKQLVDMLDKTDREHLQGMAPVFCYFGSQRSAGALALLVSPQKYDINGREFQFVIIPTAPVPFGGGLLFIPADLIEPADMSVDGLMSIYISMGVTAPQFLSPLNPKIQ
jgi:uncharacterized membrane protein